MMLNAAAMTVMPFITISTASSAIATNNMALPIVFLFGALCQGWEHLKRFLVEKTEIIWWESRQEITSYARRATAFS